MIDLLMIGDDMRILPVLPAINTYSYSYSKNNKVSKNINYTDSVSFGSRCKMPQELTTIPNMDISAIMNDAGVLTERLQTLIKRENELRASVSDVFKLATEKMGTILTDNGISLKQFPHYADKHHMTIGKQFISLMTKHGYETVSKARRSGTIAQDFDIITLKSEQLPGAELKLFRTPQRGKYDILIHHKYDFGVLSYKDSEIKLTNPAFNSEFVPTDINAFRHLTYENEELSTKGEFHAYKFNFGRNNTTSIFDKKKQLEYKYEPWNKVNEIISNDGNTIYNLKRVNSNPPNIVQKYPDKGMQVTYLLSEGNLRYCNGVLFGRIQ